MGHDDRAAREPELPEYGRFIPTGAGAVVCCLTREMSREDGARWALEEEKTILYRYRACRVAILVAGCLLLAMNPLFGQEGTIRATLSPEQIQSRITAVRESKEVDEAARTRVVALYQQAIANDECVGGDSSFTCRCDDTAAPVAETVAVGFDWGRWASDDVVCNDEIGDAGEMNVQRQDHGNRLSTLAD